MAFDNLTMAQEKTFKSSWGSFVVKIPSLPKRIEIQQRRQQYAGGAMFLPEETWDLIDAMSHLDVCTVTAPEGFPKRIERDEKNPVFFGGFDYDQLYDVDALVALGKEVTKWIDSFRRDVRTEQAKVGDSGQ